MSEAENYKACFYTSQDGLSLFYRDYGSSQAKGPTLVFLGGINRNSKDHHDIATELSHQYRVICPDYRGRGQSQSDKNWRNYQPVTYLNDLRHLFTLLNLHQVIVIGTSMGGLLAMALSAFSPTVLKGAVINDVGPDINPKGIARIIDYLGDDTAFDNWESAIKHIQNAWNDPSIKTEDDWLKNAHETFHENTEGEICIDWDPAIATALEEDTGEAHDLWPLFKGFKNIPILTIRGEVSDILTQKTFDKMIALLPNMSTLIVPETGHTPRLDTPLVLTKIKEFLNSITQK
ncbi:MAG: alpha/beta hydrolase [Rhodospirillales bacterium]|nr:alpha/beta hydrolase [Rhodospirillales bacterium]